LKGKIVVLNVCAAITILWTLFPVYTLFKIALSSAKGVYTISLFPVEISLESFDAVLTGSFYLCKFFWLQTYNSLIMAFGTVLLVAPISLLAGYALGKIKFRLKSHFTTLTMLAYLFPQAFIALPIYRIMMFYGLTNSYAGVILVQSAFSAPFSILLVLDYATSIPSEIEDAARVDGASRMQLFTKIFLPLSIPILITTSILNFLTSWNSYLIPLLLLHDENKFTLPLAIGNFFLTDAVEWNIFMAFGLLYAIPPLIFYYAFRRFIVGGLMRGALKF
jgi:multiple sugar transport system permease protein